MKRHIIILSVATVLSNGADGQALIRDSLFGTDGIATYALPVGSLQYTEILELPNNYILHGGYDYDITQNDFNIDMVKTDYCGAVDSSFGVNGLVRHKFSHSEHRTRFLSYANLYLYLWSAGTFKCRLTTCSLCSAIFTGWSAGHHFWISWFNGTTVHPLYRVVFLP